MRSIWGWWGEEEEEEEDHPWVDRGWATHPPRCKRRGGGWVSLNVF